MEIPVHSETSRRSGMTQKVVEVVGISKESFAKAAENAVLATTKIYFDIEH